MTARKPKVSPGRAALAAKRVRVEHYDIQTADQETVDAANATLERARQRLMFLTMADQTRDGYTDALGAAEGAVRDAEQTLRDCFWRLELVGLRDDAERDRLTTAHPVAEDGEGRDLLVAYLAACASNIDLTAEEWAEEIAKPTWTTADRDALFQKVRLANQRSGNDTIPKD